METTWTRWRGSRNRQEQAKAAGGAEDGRQVLDENEVAVDEDGYAERGVGAAISGRTSNDMQKQKDGMILETIVPVLHQIFTQLPLLIHLCQTNFNHNLMFETVLHH